ncbi:VTT domain-containing protein [Oscillatoria sp. CS-180]|uniref:TVP38/TMEM64 family protein n=1 Tax=Oscillatoria sp. CS-180 TaxID=3021720 RepID=UPI00232F755A|nr:VTT domain-containing protein [Oscillatoria sp. CS-180]MDB9527622.1 VTT domain-containing protein [Oscillatoria sp. CS-180]
MKRSRLLKALQFLGLLLGVALLVWLINHYGIAQLRSQVEQLGPWAPIGIFLLRFTSVVIPALPGTAYSVLAGGLLGFSQGLAVICVADLLSCSLSFFLARQYGRGLVQRFVGKNFMHRIDTLSQRHLERNFFLMTGCLMTGFFDFVCYGVGLTKAPLVKFAPALIISIAVSNPPIVALGAGLLEGGKLLLGFALLGIFGLAIATGLVQRHQDLKP